MNTVEQLRSILKNSHTIAMVGLSADWYRPSFFAAKYMQEHGYRIIPVNPRYAKAGTAILGETCYAQLSDIPVSIDIVDVFRKSADVPPIAQQAVQISARCLWQQIGVMSEEGEHIARDAGLTTVMNRCVKIEHARLFGGLHWVGVNTGIISARRPT